ncbi:hypothetical protein chiPu_0008074 [Chiloscyllium punctatum]|uniref:Uncharacterized protein n=1 Tax=Chiloscyllium punctatum TaxID=137246 RepID=A0A401SGV4_CHIPU|nr:hypothetical protein [Chiloscyllium punctatum]
MLNKSGTSGILIHSTVRNHVSCDRSTLNSPVSQYNHQEWLSTLPYLTTVAPTSQADRNKHIGVLSAIMVGVILFSVFMGK